MNRFNASKEYDIHEKTYNKTYSLGGRGKHYAITKAANAYNIGNVEKLTHNHKNAINIVSEYKEFLEVRKVQQHKRREKNRTNEILQEVK